MIDDHIKNNRLKVKIRPNSPKNQIRSWDKEKEQLNINIKAPPQKGKANKELINFMQKTLKKKVTITSGKTSKNKILNIS
ncbi:YggU family protein [Candidatus Woesearchaeota archaeon]|nr:YggU family protein [Candidatus Woesearchaeota archaeon]